MKDTPKGYRPATEEELKCLPRGALLWNGHEWAESGLIGGPAQEGTYIVPIVPNAAGPSPAARSAILEGYRLATTEDLKYIPKGARVWYRGKWTKTTNVWEPAVRGWEYIVPITQPEQPATGCLHPTAADPETELSSLPTLRGTDPKGEAGKDKCPLWLIPPKPLEEAAFVHALGARKYGPWNWRRNKVSASTYISAIMRHLNAWRSGEDNDPESGRSHLAHIVAGCFILMDAALFGNLIDDRAKPTTSHPAD